MCASERTEPRHFGDLKTHPHIIILLVCEVILLCVMTYSSTHTLQLPLEQSKSYNVLLQTLKTPGEIYEYEHVRKRTCCPLSPHVTVLIINLSCCATVAVGAPIPEYTHTRANTHTHTGFYWF